MSKFGEGFVFFWWGGEGGERLKFYTSNKSYVMISEGRPFVAGEVVSKKILRFQWNSLGHAMILKRDVEEA